MRVLIIKTSSLGDVIHTLPAVSDAAAAVPGLHIDWAVEEAFAEIPGWHPAVQRVIPVALRRWRKTLLRRSTRSEWRACKAALREHRYDRVIDAQGLVKSAFLARVVDAPVYGQDRDSAREPFAARSYQHPVAVPRDMHAVERTRLLFARALGYEPPRGTGDYGVRAQFAAPPALAQPTLLFFHGTARDEKLWPESHWIELAGLAGAAGYAAWLPWGNDTERERALRIAGSADNCEVLPRQSLAGLAQKLLQVSGAVAVDTGLGHLAAALDVPAVSLYGPTRTALIGAYGANQVHLESPLQGGDAAQQMAAISAGRAWSELRQLLPQAARDSGAGA